MMDSLKEAWNLQADQHNQWDDLGIDEIIEFAQKVEREACASLCDSLWQDDAECSEYARAIRQRGGS